MFSRLCLIKSAGRHHESGTTGGMIRWFTASSLCYFKGTSTIGKDSDRRGINISGVDFWHAVEFSRNGHFLRTHPLGLSSGRFPSVLRFRLYQTVSGLISSVLSRFPLSRFPFRRIRLYQNFRAGLTGRSFPIDREWLLRIDVPRSRQILTVADRTRSSSRQLFKSTSPRGPCQRLLWGEGENNSSAGVHAHQAAIGTVALRSAAATSPVSPARAARPPRTKT
jgi:hypothetical protein